MFSSSLVDIIHVEEVISFSGTMTTWGFTWQHLCNQVVHILYRQCAATIPNGVQCRDAAFFSRSNRPSLIKDWTQVREQLVKLQTVMLAVKIPWPRIELTCTFLQTLWPLPMIQLSHPITNNSLSKVASRESLRTLGISCLTISHVQISSLFLCIY